jgi:integrase
MAETWLLQWEDIDWEAKEEQINIYRSKNTSSHRFLTLSEPLVAWIAPYIKPSGPICGPECGSKHSGSFYRHFRGVRYQASRLLESEGVSATGLIDWDGDTMRHSFGSYHSTAFQSDHLTAQQMGHGANIRMLRTYYKGRVRAPEARAFWALRPPDVFPDRALLEGYAKEFLDSINMRQRGYRVTFKTRRAALGQPQKPLSLPATSSGPGTLTPSDPAEQRAAS